MAEETLTTLNLDNPDALGDLPLFGDPDALGDVALFGDPDALGNTWGEVGVSCVDASASLASKAMDISQDHLQKESRGQPRDWIITCPAHHGAFTASQTHELDDTQDSSTRAACIDSEMQDCNTINK